MVKAIFLRGKRMLSQHNEEPLYDPGELVWLRPERCGTEDKRPYVIIEPHIGSFGWWSYAVQPAEKRNARLEFFPEYYLTNIDPYTPAAAERLGRKYRNRAGGFLQSIEGGFPELKRMLAE
jgi:hypothetical protein